MCIRDSHNNCVVLAVDEYKMQWRFLVCAGYPWNFAWVNMPSNPIHRMAIQVMIAISSTPCVVFRFVLTFAPCTDCVD